MSPDLIQLVYAGRVHDGYDVAELFKLNPQTVRNWIDRGELRAVRVGPRRVRIRRSDLDAFIEASTTKGPSVPEAGVAQAEPASTEEALAELRSQLAVAAADDDPSSIADALASIAESAPSLADRLKAGAPGGDAS